MSAPAGRPARGGPQDIPVPPGSRPGPDAPWAAQRGLVVPTIDEVRRSLGPGDAAPGPEPTSAVLAPLYARDGDPYLVLTRRAWHLRAHSGEVSFPGGRREGDEALWSTALRESLEEIGLDPAGVECLGELTHLSTVSSASTIVPFVGLLPDGVPDLTPSPDEVDAIVHVPLAEFLEPGVYRSELWRWDGAERVIHFFELDGDTVWGATASMLVDLLTRVVTR